MEIKFEVYGVPKGKQRPRICYSKGKTVTYTPKQTKDYEKKIKTCYQTLSSNIFEENIPVEVYIKAYFPIPQNASEELKEKFIKKEILPTKPPDVDNCAKVVCDALNGVAFTDDRQICKLIIEKYYSDIPKIVVKIKEFEVNSID